MLIRNKNIVLLFPKAKKTKKNQLSEHIYQIIKQKLAKCQQKKTEVDNEM